MTMPDIRPTNYNIITMFTNVLFDQNKILNFGRRRQRKLRLVRSVQRIR